MHRHRPGDGEQATLAVRQVFDVPVQILVELELDDRPNHLGGKRWVDRTDEVARVGAKVLRIGGDAEVLEHCRVVEQLERLERPRQPGPRSLERRQVCDVDIAEHDATFGRCEPADRVDERCLAGSVRSDQAGDRARHEPAAHVVDGDHGAVAHGEALDRQRSWRDHGVVGGRLGVGDVGELDHVRPAPLARLLDEPEQLDPLGGDAVLVAENRQQDRHAADQLDPAADTVPRRLEDLLVQTRRRHRRTHERAEQVTDPADEDEADVGDRREVRERLVADRAEPEREQDAAQRGDGGGEGEGEQLRFHDVDAERRRGPLVGPHGDEPTAAAAPAHVRHHPHRQHRHHHEEDPVTPRVVDRSDVPAEEPGVPDLGALHATGVLPVAEQHQLHRRAQPERDDGEVDATSSNRRQPEEDAERDGGGDTGEQPERKRDVEHGDETAGDERAEAGDGVLAQRELAGVAREHDHREHDDPHAHHHGQPVDPLQFLGQHQEGDEAEAEQHPVPRKAPVADHRQPSQEVVAQRQRPSAKHEEDDDDNERERRAQPRLIDEPPDQRLTDAERETGRRSDRERPEVGDERGGEAGQDQLGHRRHLQGDDRHDEDACRRGEGGSQRPVEHRDPIRRQPDGRRRTLALGHGLGGEAELA